MNINSKKIKIIIISVVIVALIPILIATYNQYKITQQKLEEERIAEEQRLAAEQEKLRIENLPISKKIYLAINEPYKLDGQILEGNASFIDIDGNKYLISNSACNSIVYCSDNDTKYEIEVSDLYEAPHIDNYKENIPELVYTQEEAEYLDLVLKQRIENVGYKTRAAVVEAARFLSMMFKYKIPYFCENGRLTGNGCDGEGRFYHQGLYLSEDKFNVLNPDGIFKGPKVWGGTMNHTCGTSLKPNGLDCSGFVSWVLVQAGFDPGDYGAGSNYEGDAFCLPDLSNGDAGAIWLDEIDPDKIQAGDLIAWEGTIAVVVGVDDENIYTAHQYWDNGLEVVTDTKISLKDYPYGEDCGDWQYVSLMDNYYLTQGNGQGKYTPMWIEAN